MAETAPRRYRLTETGPVEDDIDGDYVLVPFPQVQLADQMAELQAEIQKLRRAMIMASRGGY